MDASSDKLSFIAALMEKVISKEVVEQTLFSGWMIDSLVKSAYTQS